MDFRVGLGGKDLASGRKYPNKRAAALSSPTLVLGAGRVDPGADHLGTCLHLWLSFL